MAGYRCRFVVSGRVQGVGFRFYAREAARVCGVDGWVRNRGDGRVEAEAQGTRHAVEAFANMLRDGPRMGHVESLEARDIAPERHASGFEIRF